MSVRENGMTDRVGGSQAAISDLYERYRGALGAFFRRRHRDRFTAEDLVQETFARLLRCSHRLAGARSPCAYLFGVARHVSLDAWRRTSVREAVRHSADPWLGAAAADAPVRSALLDAIAALPALDREILELRFQRDLSYAEIAQVLDRPIGTVRSRLHHALRRLREVWQGNDTAKAIDSESCR